ncbi:unnamed protein product [Effrenium voratum]|nr:unnamed protein product [Effrenium voratum]
MAQRREQSTRVCAAQAGVRSLPAALHCEKLLLPFLQQREVLRYIVACRACHASAQHQGRLQLTTVAQLPLSQLDADRLAARLDLASICSIDIEVEAALTSDGCRSFPLALFSWHCAARTISTRCAAEAAGGEAASAFGDRGSGDCGTVLSGIRFDWLQLLHLPSSKLSPKRLKEALQQHPRAPEALLGWLPATLGSLQVDAGILKNLSCCCPEAF